MADLLQDDHPWIHEYFHGPRGARRGRPRSIGLSHGDPGQLYRRRHLRAGPDRSALLGLRRLDRAGSSGQDECAYYDILFAGSVTGLQVDSTVRYRGIPVGRVSRDPASIPATSSSSASPSRWRRARPCASDTEASLELQGITGVTYVLLKGGTQDQRRLPITTKAPYPRDQVDSVEDRELFESAPDLLSKATTLVERVTLLFNDENEKAISETLANLRAITTRFTTGGGNHRRAAQVPAKSAVAKIDTMSGELAELAKDLRSQLDTPGTGDIATVADVLANASAAVEQLQKTGTEFQELAHDLRGQLVTPGPEGRPTVADLLREGTVTLQRIQTVGTNFEGLVDDLRKQMVPGAEGSTTVADVLARGAVTIDQLNKTAVELSVRPRPARALTTPNSAGSATVADLVQQGKATLERVQGMSSEFEALAHGLRTDLAVGEKGQSKVADLVTNASTAAANIGRMSTEIQGLAKDLRGEFSGMEGQHGEKISGLLTQADMAAEQITSMSHEFELLAKDLRTNTGPLVGKASTAFTNMQNAMEQFGNTSKSFGTVADQLDATIAENREPLRDFSNSGLYELSQLLTEMRLLVASMTRVSSQLERDPARFFFGDRRQGFQAE